VLNQMGFLKIKCVLDDGRIGVLTEEIAKGFIATQLLKVY